MYEDSLNLLVIEDNPGDIALLMRVLGTLETRVTMTVAEDGESALCRLRTRDAVGNPYLPDLILLDLHLPRKSGWEVLVELKQDPLLKHIPVLVLTSSLAPGDILRGYELNANAYLHKPLGLAQFREVAKAVQDFWFRWSQLPSGHLRRRGL